MHAIKSVRKFIEREPANPDAEVLSDLVLALESERPFPLAHLYELQLDHFELALQVMRDWRLARYYEGTASQLAGWRPQGEPEGGGRGAGH